MSTNVNKDNVSNIVDRLVSTNLPSADVFASQIDENKSKKQREMKKTNQQAIDERQQRLDLHIAHVIKDHIERLASLVSHRAEQGNRKINHILKFSRGEDEGFLPNDLIHIPYTDITDKVCAYFIKRGYNITYTVFDGYPRKYLFNIKYQIAW